MFRVCPFVHSKLAQGQLKLDNPISVSLSEDFMCLPFRAPEASDPAAAQRFLAEHDALVASGKEPHRVTTHFAGQHEGSLRWDLEQHAAGHGMSDRLASEVRSYQLCKIDDTWAEAAHRDVSRTGKRMAAGTVAYISATQRLDQTMARTDTMTPQELRQFYHCMRKASAIVQVKTRPARELRPPRQKAKVIQAKVYRFDEVKMMDWSAEFGQSVSFIETSRQVNRSIAQRLQIEYLDNVVADGQTLSLPVLDDVAMDRAVGLAIEDLPGVLHQQDPVTDQFFLVVDRNASRKHRLRTAAMSDDAVVKAVSVQRMASWSGEGSSEAAAQGQILAFHDGDPQVIDFLAMAPWPVLRGGLRRWQVDCAQVPGCAALARPELARPSWASLSLEDAPTICVLEALASAGWQRGVAPARHTRGSAKVFMVKDPIASKSYLRCLLCLEDIVGPGKMEALVSGQPAMYYNCVLAADQPMLVPLDQTAVRYKEILAIGPDQAILALQDDDNCSDEVVINRRVAKVASSKVRQARRQGPKTASASAADKDWGAMALAHPAQVGQQAICDMSVGAQHDVLDMAVADIPDIVGGVSAASGSNEAPPGLDAAASMAIVPVGPDPVQPPLSLQDRRFEPLEGVAVRHDDWGVHGQPGSYRRILVTCPHHGSKKDPCMKSRKFGVKDGLTSGFGRLRAVCVFRLLAGQARPI